MYVCTCIVCVSNNKYVYSPDCIYRYRLQSGLTVCHVGLRLAQILWRKLQLTGGAFCACLIEEQRIDVEQARLFSKTK